MRLDAAIHPSATIGDDNYAIAIYLQSCVSEWRLDQLVSAEKPRSRTLAFEAESEDADDCGDSMRLMPVKFDPRSSSIAGSERNSSFRGDYESVVSELNVLTPEL